MAGHAVVQETRYSQFRRATGCIWAYTPDDFTVIYRQQEIT